MTLYLLSVYESGFKGKRYCEVNRKALNDRGHGENALIYSETTKSSFITTVLGANFPD